MGGGGGVGGWGGGWFVFFFFFNDTATTEIYTLSLHDALPISGKTGEASNAERWRSVNPQKDVRSAPLHVVFLGTGVPLTGTLVQL